MKDSNFLLTDKHVNTGKKSECISASIFYPLIYAILSTNKIIGSEEQLREIVG